MPYDLIATSDYIRSREIFLIRADMGEYLIDYYIHRKDHAPVTKAEHDAKLKDLIACFAIHLAARTTLETHAWTLHIVSEEPYSLFVTGSTGEIDDKGIARGFLVGHILTEHIRHSDTNGLHAQFTSKGKTFKSYVSCDSSDIPAMVEAFYQQSEQRPIRIKVSSTSDTAVGLAALPGYDPEWFRAADIDELVASSGQLDKTEMRNCAFTFTCDCSPEKLLPFFRTLAPETLHELYGDDESLQITCPRCGKQFTIDRDQILQGA
jgi:hypothetical protein